jgi:hypothetical protein
VKWFTHFGANFGRCALGVTLIVEPDDSEYALALFLGPLMFMCGWEQK